MKSNFTSSTTLQNILGECLGHHEASTVSVSSLSSMPRQPNRTVHTPLRDRQLYSALRTPTNHVLLAREFSTQHPAEVKTVQHECEEQPESPDVRIACGDSACDLKS